MDLNRRDPLSAKNNESMIFNLRLLAVWSEGHNFKCAMIADTKREIHLTKTVKRTVHGHHGLQYARLPCLSPTPGAYSNS